MTKLKYEDDCRFTNINTLKLKLIQVYEMVKVIVRSLFTYAQRSSASDFVSTVEAL